MRTRGGPSSADKSPNFSTTASSVSVWRTPAKPKIRKLSKPAREICFSDLVQLETDKSNLLCEALTSYYRSRSGLMLDEQQIAELLIKVAVSASIASILMRFERIQKILLRDERTVSDRLQLAFIFSLSFRRKRGSTHTEPSPISGHRSGFGRSNYRGNAWRLCKRAGDRVLRIVAGHVHRQVHVHAAVCGRGYNWRNDARSGPAKRGYLVFFAVRRSESVPVVPANPSPESKCDTAPHSGTGGIQCRLQRAGDCGRDSALGSSWLIQQHSTFFLFDGQPLNFWVFLACAATTFFVVALPLRIWSSFRAEKQLAAQRVTLTEARLAALTNQINPHFLFNTLNSVSTLIRIDPDRARSMVYRLSKHSCGACFERRRAFRRCARRSHLSTIILPLR